MLKKITNNSNLKKSNGKKKSENTGSEGSEESDIVDLGSESSEDDMRLVEVDVTEPEGVEIRHVVQIHCTKWPDIGVPNSCEEMVELISEVDQHKKGLNDPILVHCSAGIGRTGTFVAIHSSLHREKFGQEIDVKSLVLHLRSQRVGMVQSTDQYMFIYKVLSHILEKNNNGSI